MRVLLRYKYRSDDDDDGDDGDDGDDDDDDDEDGDDILSMMMLIGTREALQHYVDPISL